MAILLRLRDSAAKGVLNSPPLGCLQPLMMPFRAWDLLEPVTPFGFNIYGNHTLLQDFVFWEPGFHRRVLAYFKKLQQSFLGEMGLDEQSPRHFCSWVEVFRRHPLPNGTLVYFGCYFRASMQGSRTVKPMQWRSPRRRTTVFDGCWFSAGQGQSRVRAHSFCSSPAAR